VNSTNQILTTHTGSLPRPVDLLDLMKADPAVSPTTLIAWMRGCAVRVAESVEQQRACGIDIVTDGEMGKLGFFSYVSERLSGLEQRPGAGFFFTFEAEEKEFPEYDQQATYRPEVHPTVVWAKFKAMAEGARLASDKLWGRS
jgi:5-methyltetrahydropteroyltriglutamate--homocysteine methyltransferase